MPAQAVRITIDNLPQIRRDLKAVAPATDKAYIKRMKTALGPVVSTARTLASWSNRLQQAIKPSVTLRAVAIRSGWKRRGPKTSQNLSSLWEFGSSGGGRKWVRHPHWAAVGSARYQNRRNWSQQPVRPHVWPAVRQHRSEVLEAAEQAIGDAVRVAGFTIRGR